MEQGKRKALASRLQHPHSPSSLGGRQSWVQTVRCERDIWAHVGRLQAEDFADDLHQGRFAARSLLSQLFLLMLDEVIIQLRRTHVVLELAPIEVQNVLPDRTFAQIADPVPEVLAKFWGD